MTYHLLTGSDLAASREILRFHRRFEYLFTQRDGLSQPTRESVIYHNEVYDWVAQQFGMTDALRWDTDGYDFGFRDVADAFAFRIRWG